MPDRYYLAKALAWLDKVSADPDADPTELAEWAEAQPRTTPTDSSVMGTGVLVDRQGHIVARTQRVIDPLGVHVWYTLDGPEPHREIGLAMAATRTVMCTYSDVCYGQQIRGDHLLDSAEVAEILGVSQSSINVAMSSPETSPKVARMLPAPIRKIGRSWVWRRSDVEAAVEREQ